MPAIKTLLDRKGREVVTIHRSETVLEAAHLMNDKRIGALVIVDDDGTLAGIFTERDILTRIVASEVAPSEAIVENYMTREPKFVSPETTLDECSKIMTEKRVRHLPVIDEGKVAGMISIGDITRWELDSSEETIEHLKGYMYGR